MTQLKKMADDVFDAMRGFVARKLETVVARLDALESRTPEKGADGLNGKDADETAIAAKVTEQVTKAIESIPAPKDGTNGERGLAGEKGADGRDGREGEPGRDALALDVLDAIDPTRRYQRGTFASHAGGIVRAFRVTDPLDGDLAKSGWTVVVNGIESEEEESPDDGRTVKRITRYTNGQTLVRVTNTGAVKDAGIYQATEQYLKGDGVTWGGSWWIAQRDSKGDKPDSGSGAWRLAVKRGRDGKDFTK